jgi:hypothetical protein
VASAVQATARTNGRPPAVAGNAVLARSRRLVDDAQLACALLGQIEARADSVRTRFETLERRRAGMTSSERAATREALRAEAIAALDELERLQVTASLTMAIAELCHGEMRGSS